MATYLWRGGAAYLGADGYLPTYLGGDDDLFTYVGRGVYLSSLIYVFIHLHIYPFAYLGGDIAGR